MIPLLSHMDPQKMKSSPVHESSGNGDITWGSSHECHAHPSLLPTLVCQSVQTFILAGFSTGFVLALCKIATMKLVTLHKP